MEPKKEKLYLSDNMQNLLEKEYGQFAQKDWLGLTFDNTPGVVQHIFFDKQKKKYYIELKDQNLDAKNVSIVLKEDPKAFVVRNLDAQEYVFEQKINERRIYFAEEIQTMIRNRWAALVEADKGRMNKILLSFGKDAEDAATMTRNHRIQKDDYNKYFITIADDEFAKNENEWLEKEAPNFVIMDIQNKKCYPFATSQGLMFNAIPMDDSTRVFIAKHRKDFEDNNNINKHQKKDNNPNKIDNKAPNVNRINNFINNNQFNNNEVISDEVGQQLVNKYNAGSYLEDKEHKQLLQYVQQISKKEAEEEILKAVKKIDRAHHNKIANQFNNNGYNDSNHSKTVIGNKPKYYNQNPYKSKKG